VLGEAVPLPSRIRLPLEEPRPKSDDPPIAENWQKAPASDPEYASAITGWRIQEQAASEQTDKKGKG
jgi:hypothetical protein